MMEEALSGQNALVTGGSTGIGEAIAIALGRAGASVAVNYLDDPAPAEQVVQKIEEAGGQGIAVQADVSQEDQVQRMFREAIQKFGTLDILVNNAGIQKDSDFVDMTLDQWNAVLGVNLTGYFLCAREAAREFIRRGVRPEVSLSAGKIICISSVHEVIPWAGHVNYATSKGGVVMFMKSVAQELAPHNIRVNGIAPGAVKTAINKEAWESPEAAAKLLELIPYGRVGEPADIGRAAVWLASDASDYVVGSTVTVDGGMCLYPGFAEGG